MRLLQSEIDANPAATPTVSPNTEGRVVMNAGVAVLELNNSSESENNFWVWVRAVRPEDAWLEKHCRLEALGAVHGVQDNLENGKYKAYVRQRDARRLTVRIAPPLQPESHAGVVEMVAMVQSQVPLRVGNEEQSLFEFPFRVAVRPYARWSLEIEPKETRVRMLRRKKTLWATVENSGNDWLYVEVKLPKESGQLLFDREVERIAVPPAPSGKEPARRRVPIHLRSRYRNVRGSAVRVPVPLSATRIDAPSVARFPSDADIAVASLNLTSPVLTLPTTDSKTASGAEVAYYPPIPATFTDFVTSLRTSLMSVVSLVLVCLALFYVAGFLYETTLHRYNNGKKVQFSPEPKDGTIQLGDTLTITGANLEGSDIDVTADKVPLKYTSSEQKDGSIQVTIPPQPNVPAGADATVTVKKRGFRFLPLPSIDGTTVLNLHVKIGKASVAVKNLDLLASAQLKLGDKLTIEHTGPDGFGDKPGLLKLDSRTLTDVRWGVDKIEASIPNEDGLAAAGVTIYVKRADGTAEGRKSLTIVDPKTLQVTTATGTTDTTATGTATATGTDATATTQTSDSTTGPATTGPTTNATTGTDAASRKTATYSAIAEALNPEDFDTLLKAADAAKKNEEPYWREYAAYVGAVTGTRDMYGQAALTDLKKHQPKDDPFGQALYQLANAEVAAITGHKEQAGMDYDILKQYLKDNGLESDPLFKAALARHG